MINGKIAEQLVICRLLDMGFIVSQPVLRCQYDILVDLNGQIIKIQIKRGFDDGSRPDTLRENLLGTVYTGGDGNRDVQYSNDEVDAFAIYDPREEEIYWLWFDEAPNTELRRKYRTMKQHRINEKLPNHSEPQWQRR